MLINRGLTGMELLLCLFYAIMHIGFESKNNEEKIKRLQIKSLLKTVLNDKNKATDKKNAL